MQTQFYLEERFSLGMIFLVQGKMKHIFCFKFRLTLKSHYTLIFRFIFFEFKLNFADFLADSKVVSSFKLLSLTVQIVTIFVR